MGQRLSIGIVYKSLANEKVVLLERELHHILHLKFKI